MNVPDKTVKEPLAPRRDAAEARAKAEVGMVTLVRVLLGITIFAHGYQKMMDFGAWQDSLAQMGFANPGFWAWPSMLAEVLGGLSLILGFATIWGAAAVVIQMLVAVFMVHLGNGFFAADGGVELPLFLAAAALYFVVRGGGPISVDALIAYSRTDRTQPHYRRKFALRTLSSSA